MFEPGAGLQVLDGEFDGGVLAVEPIDGNDVAGQVGEERVVPPVGPELLLGGAGQAGPANHEAPGHSSGACAGGVVAFGDLGFVVAGVLDRLPSGFVDAGDRCLDRSHVGSDRHRVARVGTPQVGDRVAVPKARVEPERQVAGRVVAPCAGDEFVDEACCAALGVRGAFLKRPCKISPVPAIVASNG